MFCARTRAARARAPPRAQAPRKTAPHARGCCARGAHGGAPPARPAAAHTSQHEQEHLVQGSGAYLSIGLWPRAPHGAPTDSCRPLSIVRYAKRPTRSQHPRERQPARSHAVIDVSVRVVLRRQRHRVELGIQVLSRALPVAPRVFQEAWDVLNVAATGKL